MTKNKEMTSVYFDRRIESTFTGTNDFHYRHCIVIASFICVTELLKRSEARDFCAIFEFINFKVLSSERG